MLGLDPAMLATMRLAAAAAAAAAAAETLRYSL